MLIAVAGPYSADSAEERQGNLAALNEAAVAVLNLGHIPVIGVNAALPVVAQPETDHYETIMAISLALVDRCDAILMIGESAGANRERALIESKGLPVYRNVSEVPSSSSLPR